MPPELWRRFLDWHRPDIRTNCNRFQFTCIVINRNVKAVCVLKNNGLVIRAFFSALMGHCIAIVFIFAAALAVLSFEDPSSGSGPIAIAAVVIGALFCGFSARRLSLGFAGGILSGVMYAALPFVLSFFGEAGLSSGKRWLMAACAVVIASAVSALTPKKKRTSVGKRKRNLYRNARR